MKENLLYIINNFGVNNQQRKLQEEVFELQEAIIDYKYVEVYKDSPAEKYHKEHIEEEFADVMVLLEQFKAYYNLDNDKIVDIMYKKIDRTLERIKENN